jgi:hypothetical protein
VEAEAIEALLTRLWETFPSFCIAPADVKTLFDKTGQPQSEPLAQKLGLSLLVLFCVVLCFDLGCSSAKQHFSASL